MLLVLPTIYRTPPYTQPITKKPTARRTACIPLPTPSLMSLYLNRRKKKKQERIQFRKLLNKQHSYLKPLERYLIRHLRKGPITLQLPVFVGAKNG